ncbi:methyltransferase domain-containing protein [Exilibacterium tricleocarpae]|nr:methyltransferase domain-containing protein [Exilibacterium tricleocarpae]
MNIKNQGFITLAPGVLLADNAEGNDIIEVDGVQYNRFMDGFYIDRSTAELTTEQVFALCRSRSENPNLVSNGPGNEQVKSIISSYILAKNPSTLLELGAGIEPTLTHKADDSIYIISDADDIVVQQNSELGRECSHFGKGLPLLFDDNFFDLIFAVFVFHFSIYQDQIQEISRCLKTDGVLIANVYLLDTNERAILEKKFRDEGLISLRISDPMSSCKNNEYWLFSFSEETLDLNNTIFQKILASTVSKKNS